jgi:hypothetical protein
VHLVGVLFNIYLSNTHFVNWLLISRNVGRPAGHIIIVHIPYSLHARTNTHVYTHVYTPLCVGYICPGRSLAGMPTRQAIYVYRNIEALSLIMVAVEKQ